MATRNIQLTRSDTAEVQFSNYGAYRMKVEVTDVTGDDLDKYIFIFQRKAPSAYTSLSCDDFVAVAGPPQLASYPAGAPDPDVGWPYYRLSELTMDFASAAQADAFWKELYSSVCATVTALNKLDTLKVSEVVWCDVVDTSTSSQSS